MYVCYGNLFDDYVDDNVFYFVRNIVGFILFLFIFEEVEEMFFFLFEFGLYNGFLL